MYMTTTEQIQKYADTCLNITTAAYEGKTSEQDYAEVRQQAEDILVSVLSDTAGTERTSPVHRVVLSNEEGEHELSLCRTATEKSANSDVYIFPLIGKTELADMYVIVTDTVIKCQDKDGVISYYALYYSRARKEVLFKAFRENDAEANPFLEISAGELAERFRKYANVASYGNFLSSVAVKAYLSRISKK